MSAIANSSQSFPYSAHIAFKKEYLRKGSHILALPMGDDLLRLIGLVTAYWCDFEHKFNSLIASLEDVVELPEGWRHMAFRRRRNLLKEKLAEVEFEQNDAEGRPRMFKLIDDAADLHWRRNVIVHGAYNSIIGPYSSNAAWTAVGWHNGREVSIQMDPGTLEKLWHDIAHLSGELAQIARLIGEIQGLWLTLSDTEILQVFARSNHPESSTRDK